MANSPSLTGAPVAVALALVLLVLVAAGLARVGGTGHARGTVTAVARALVQLAAVSFVVAAVLASVPLVLAFLLGMFSVATATVIRRLRQVPAARRVAAVSIGLPAGLTIAVLLATGAVPVSGPVLLPIGGIVVGGAMTATTLAGRRAASDLLERRGEIDAALSLGLRPRAAARETVRRAASEALVPALDQTRNVGLVTLPGAFVGMVLGGASPAQAGLVQLLVLVALLAAESMASLLAADMVGGALVGEQGVRQLKP